MKRLLGLLIALTTVTAACSSTNSPTTVSGVPESSTISVSASPVAPLVGRWERVTTCQELVSELDEAGLGALAAHAWVGNTSASGQSSYKPGSPKPTLARPCAGAIARVHSHFFTQLGQFGSLDWTGQQVDDAPYRIVNDDTLTIGGGDTTFRYRIINGDTLTLDPVISEAKKRQALADPTKFSEAGWAVSVAYASHTWKRVSCSGWC